MKSEDKLRLITEHASEYYKGRFYAYTEGGFVTLQPMSDNLGYAVYIHDMFVSKDHRGGPTLYKLLKIIKNYVEENRIVTAYCRVEINNPHLKMLQGLYKKFKFEEIHNDGTALYYKRILL